MSKNNSRKKQAKILRLFRKIHRITGVFLFVFFFILSISGILLGLKNNSNGLIFPKSFEGTSTNLKHWLTIDSLHKKACFVLHNAVDKNLSLKLNRIDIRKKNGMVKFVFEDNNWEIQLDGATGKVLNIGKRHSDFIENIHDGSILDKWFQTPNKIIKVIYTSIMGLALLLFTITGFWMWYGPKKMRRSRK
jgi:uncharacterized iron-regulated membrane protein